MTHTLLTVAEPYIRPFALEVHQNATQYPKKDDFISGLIPIFQGFTDLKYFLCNENAAGRLSLISGLDVIVKPLCRLGKWRNSMCVSLPYTRH